MSFKYVYAEAVFNAFILPHLYNFCTMWGYCNISLEDNLVRFQKRAAILTFDKKFNTHSIELFN